MRALTVYESMRFERGKDPRSTMGIGRIKELEKIDNWVHPPESERRYYNRIEDGDYKGHLVAIYKSIDTSVDLYVPIILFPGGFRPNRPSEIRDGDMKGSAEEAWKEARELIDDAIHKEETGYWDAADLRESVNFERGRDPKDTIGIGNRLARVANKYDIPFEDAKAMTYTFQMFFPDDFIRKEFDMNVFHISNELSIEELREYGLHPEDNNFSIIQWADDNIQKAWELFDAARKDAGVTESVNFERGQDPKSAMGIGKFANTFVIEEISSGWVTAIKDPYDQRKFLQNLGMGLFPSNFEAYGHRYGMDEEIDKMHIQAHELSSFDWVIFDGKEWPVGK